MGRRFLFSLFGLRALALAVRFVTFLRLSGGVSFGHFSFP